MTGIRNYDVERPREYGSLHVQPEPDGFTHESPIRAFTDWTVNGRYAIGKGFRPSLQHLTVYLDAMERLEGWALLQVLEAASGSPSFVFRKAERHCVNHPTRPVRDNLDGDDLCQECCENWAKGERE